MLVLKILAIIIICLVIIGTLLTFDSHCDEKFGHKFLTKGSMIILSLAIGLIFVGFLWYNSALKSHGDLWNGRIVMALGGLFSLSLLFRNIRQTNVIYGILGTTIQLSVFPFVVYFGAGFFGLWLILGMFTIPATPVYVVNKE